MRINNFEIVYDSGYYSYREYTILTKGVNIGNEILAEFNQTHPNLKSFLKVLVDKGEDRDKLIDMCKTLVVAYEKKESAAWIAKKVLTDAAKVKREMEKKL